MYNKQFVQLVVISILITAGLILLLKNNFLLFFIALELIVLAINLNFVSFSLLLGNAQGLFVAIILLAIAAIDTAIGLSLLLRYSSLGSQISIASIIHLKG